MATKTRKVTMNLPNRPQGEMVDVAGLGMMANGDTWDVEMDDAYALALSETPGFKVLPKPKVKQNQSDEEAEEAASAVAEVLAEDPSPINDANAEGGDE